MSKIEDGAGELYDSLPKLNTLLLEECVNWAIRSHQGKLDVSEPSHYQDAWAQKILYKSYRVGVTKKLWKKSQNLQSIQDHPCGTAYCIAGRGLELTGQLQFRMDFIETESVQSTVANIGQANIPYKDPYEVIPYEGDVINAQGDFHLAGAAVFGLTYPEAVELFDGSNKIKDIVKISKKIAASRGETLVLLDLKER